MVMAIVLIAGGTGLIGQETTSLLLSNNHQVRHLSRSPKADAQVPTYAWDIKKKYIDPAALEGVDYVINFAGAGIADQRWTEKRKQAIIDSRVQGNLLFKQYIEEGKLSPKKFISSAAIGIYGDRGDEILTEKSSPGTEGFLVKSCLLWEDSVREIAETNVPVAYVRIGIVMSKDGGALEKMLLPAKFGLGSYFGDGSQIYSWVHILDIARVFAWLVEQPSAVGVYNGTAPHPVTNKHLTEVMMDVKKGPGISAPVPTFVLGLMLGEMKEAVLTGSHVLPKRLEEEGFNFEFKKVDLALKDLISS